MEHRQSINIRLEGISVTHVEKAAGALHVWIKEIRKIDDVKYYGYGITIDKYATEVGDDNAINDCTIIMAKMLKEKNDEIERLNAVIAEDVIENIDLRKEINELKEELKQYKEEMVKSLLLCCARTETRRRGK